MPELDMKDLTFFKPERDPEWGEQTFLTYNAVTGSWDVERYEAGWPLDLEAFSMGVTHWMDLTGIDPDCTAERRLMRQEAFAEGGR